MIDIEKAKITFKDFINEYEDKSDLRFELKIVHTYHVAENAKKIAQELKLSKEDIELAELIGILHDIGRFEELKITKELNSVKFDHAGHGSKMLFEEDMIRKFIEDSQYDNIIKKSIENHSRLEIEENLDERTLLHSKIIRDADKIDNYRVKKDEKVEAIFPKRVNKIEDMEESKLSDKVYNTILDKKCVDIHDRVTPLDFWVCILAFTFDLNFDVSYKIVKENDYINVLIDRFKYKDIETKSRMENIRKIINGFVDENINN
jgi:putative nucleotidyltransferase with HDIG domain